MEARITDVGVGAYVIPTDAPESDGTLEWRSTTLVVIDVSVRDVRGIGYTYADTATATHIRDKAARARGRLRCARHRQRSCREQIRHGAQRHALHVAEVLQRAIRQTESA